ncbi:flagellar FlbD family protein [Tumebacillus permanentifrigoris]|uniref:Flagellar protein FlbD n=1 Tax=Tumebacillus permanentifrigoris TaxID=378543 RepID=A0A316DBZ3_9BACL|nr:flagellar FlbD family protein [Tumebacillus permanentifrigoris]PWK12705.1 flagellar protein FlbD [Tumebacillus permanentifrigoris]
MIPVTKFNRSTVYVNATLVESVESTPDTMITLVNGKKLIVRETVEDVLKMVEEYYRRVGLLAIQVQQNAEVSDVSEQGI